MMNVVWWQLAEVGLQCFIVDSGRGESTDHKSD